MEIRKKRYTAQFKAKVAEAAKRDKNIT